jgi:RAB protein geranylgeranyltransferase component A
MVRILHEGQNWMLTIVDIYIAVVSSAHNVCPKGYYIAIVSTIAETTANHHLELEPGFERLGRIEEKFMVNPFPRKQKTRSADNIRVHQSHCTSHWKAESTTTSLSLRATTLPAISRRLLMMLRISIVGPRAMNLLLKG